MSSNRLAFAAVAIGCLLASAGGGYLASRWSAPPVAASDAPASATQSSSIAVQATELPTTENTLRTAATPPATSPAPAARLAEPAATSTARTAPPAPAPTRGKKKSLEQPPTPDRRSGGVASIPSSPQTPNAPVDIPSVEPSVQAPRTEERIAQEPPRPEPVQPAAEELVVAADSVIGLQAETTVVSDRARVEDRVEARVARDVRVRDMIAVPAGARATAPRTLGGRGGE